MRRDGFLLTAAACAVAPLARARSARAADEPSAVAGAAGAGPFAALERRFGVTVGVAAHDLGSGRRVAHRARERFPLASTWKLPLVMTVLARVEAGALSLDQPVRFTAADLESYSTIARAHPHGGRLALREVCRLTIADSDNTGADLLAPLAGGPAAVDAYLRRIGVDGVRIVHRERELPSAARRDDPDDAGTPQAMMGLVERLVARSPLAPAQTGLLLGWLHQTTTGGARLRAGVPPGWSVADKTGTYANAANDIGLLSPPSGPPIAIACYTFGKPSDAGGSAAVAECARTAIRLLR